MTLKEYIESLGMEAFAERYGLTIRATAHYRWGTRKPKPDVARRIVEDSPLTWDDIYPKRETA